MKKIILLVVMMSICLMGCIEKQQEAETLCLTWYNRGLSNMDGPESDFKNAIKANSKFAPPYYWLASFYCRAKREEESIEYFEKYLQVVDKNDPQEKDRIEMAGYFIEEMRSGNMDYDSITNKAMSKE